MALLYMDSFERYADISDMTQAGWSVTLSPSIDLSQFKFGTRSLNNGGNETSTFTLPTTYTTLFFSFYVRFSALPGGDNAFVRFYNDSGINNSNLYITSAGRLGVWGATAISFGLSTNPVITANTWHLIECKVTHSNSVGANEYLVKVDDVQILDLVGQDTLFSGSANVNAVRFTNTNAFVTSIFTDGLVIFDTTAGLNDFTGPYIIEHIVPNGNGASSQFTGSDADSVDNYLHVDEIGCDDDTSYVESNTIGHRDSYSYSNIAGGGGILGVQVSNIAQNTTATIRSIKNYTRIGSTNYDGSTTHAPLNGTYGGFRNIWENSPATATNWTISEVNNAEFGVKIES